MLNLASGRYLTSQPKLGDLTAMIEKRHPEPRDFVSMTVTLNYRIIWHTRPPYSTRPPPPIRPSPGVSKVGPTYYKTMVLYY